MHRSILGPPKLCRPPVPTGLRIRGIRGAISVERARPKRQRFPIAASLGGRDPCKFVPIPLGTQLDKTQVRNSFISARNGRP